MRFVEEIGERVTDGRTDIFDADMFGNRLVFFRLRLMVLIAQGDDVLRQRADRREGCITLHQVARRHRADMADAQAKEQARGVGLALGLDRGEEIVDRFLLPAFATEQLRAMVL